MVAPAGIGVTLRQGSTGDRPKRPTEAVDYKALGSLPGEHERLIPFKQLVNNFFSLLSNGEKAKGGRRREGETKRGEWGRASKQASFVVQKKR